MIRVSVIAAGLALLAGCQTPNVVRGTVVEAKDVAIASGPGPFDFDCDSPGQQFVQFVARAPSDRVTVRGYFHFEQSHWGTEWAPFAYIALRDANSSRAVMLEADVGLTAAVAGDFKKVNIYTEVPSSGHSKQLLVMTPLTYREIPFRVTMNPDGTVLESVGTDGVVVTPRLFSASSIQMACLTAHVKFRDVTVTSAQ